MLTAKFAARKAFRSLAKGLETVPCDINCPLLCLPERRFDFFVEWKRVVSTLELWQDSVLATPGCCVTRGSSWKDRVVKIIMEQLGLRNVDHSRVPRFVGIVRNNPHDLTVAESTVESPTHEQGWRQIWRESWVFRALVPEVDKLPEHAPRAGELAAIYLFKLCL